MNIWTKDMDLNHCATQTQSELAQALDTIKKVREWLENDSID